MGVFDKFKKKEGEPQKAKKSRLEKHIKDKAGPKYSLRRDINTSPLIIRSQPDKEARQYITENCNSVNHSHIYPGMMILFEYFKPKTKEELEYYDASPCTIFFGVAKTKQGQRVIGFNIHYYPPKIRRQILNRIFEIYKPIYTKYFSEGITKEIDAFTYKYLMDSLEKAKLNFGVRMYIPELIGKTYAVKPNEWNVAVFTEGWFKKRTREAIMKYWHNFKKN